MKDDFYCDNKGNNIIIKNNFYLEFSKEFEEFFNEYNYLLELNRIQNFIPKTTDHLKSIGEREKKKRKKK